MEAVWQWILSKILRRCEMCQCAKKQVGNLCLACWKEERYTEQLLSNIDAQLEAGIPYIWSPKIVRD